MQYCSGGPYGASDMQNLLLAASRHMFTDGPSHHYNHYHHHHHQQEQLHHQHQQYQQSLQQQELVDYYHRQAASLQEQEVQGSHMLFGVPNHHQFQPKATSLEEDSSSFHVPLSHHISPGAESASLVPITKVASIATSHGLLPHYKPVAGDDFADLGATADDTDQAAANGSRWPREETLALLRIRSEMDATFRDSALKGPLWDEVSRKLQDAGFQRSAKKCKEKFENVHKYYKKLKDGKSEKPDGRTYRFHTELEAIYAASHEHDSQAGGLNGAEIFSTMAASGMQQLERNATLQAQDTNTGPNSPSSISCGDAYEQHTFNRKRKRSSSWRTMRAFFEDLATQLMERQDALHKKFLETIEKREEERARREEAYKRQEMARMSREQDLRAREQALAVTRDAALVAFLQKITGETLHLPEMVSQSMISNTVATATAVVTGEGASTPSAEEPQDCMREGVDANSRRWPKAEVLALIRIRTSLEPRFQEAGPKAQLWEEIASSMASLGFVRSGKRCKEKWENINKYYRKTKDNVGRKLRPESATKTCPYFHQLELLYERGILASPNSSKSACKLDGPQTSGEFLDSSSRDESQQTQECVGNPDYPPGTSCVSNMLPIAANLQTTVDGRGMLLDVATTCSSNGIVAPLQNGGCVHDMEFVAGNNVKAESSCLLGPANQINVNCHPSQHFSVADRSHEGKLAAHEEQMTCHMSSGMLGVSSGSRFVREMMEIQQPQPLYERHQLDAQLQNEQGVAGMKIQSAGEEHDVEMRMQQQEEGRSMVMDEGRSHHDSATLMALVHKLATGGGVSPSCEFHDLSSPGSSSGQV